MDRRMHDMVSGRRYNDERNYDRRMPEREDYYEDGRNPYGSRGGYVVSGRHASDHGYPYEMMDDDRRYDRRMPERESYYGDMTVRIMDGRRSSDYGVGYLSNKDLRRWQEKLCKEMTPQECEMIHYDAVIHCAKEMNITFTNYTEEEFYTTVLMLYTDYRNTCGADIHTYIAMAKDFLEDRDAGVRYGEKLAAYHDAIARV